MDEELKKEIIKTREELEKKKNKIKDISELAGENIDREYPIDFNELSETELDVEMGKRVIFINENLNIINKINKKTNNKLIKIFLIIPYLLNLIFKKSFLIMKNYLQLNHILLIRLKRMADRLDYIEDHLRDLEGIQELLEKNQND